MVISCVLSKVTLSGFALCLLSSQSYVAKEIALYNPHLMQQTLRRIAYAILVIVRKKSRSGNSTKTIKNKARRAFRVKALSE